MARPKLGNSKVSLRLTPSVDEALAALATAAGVTSPNAEHSPISPVCIDAFRWFAEREGLDVSAWPAALTYPRNPIGVRMCRAAVQSATDEVRSVTRGFVVPAVVAELDTLLARVAAWPRYSSKIKWNDSTKQYEHAMRRTSAPPTLVLWAAVVEYLDALAGRTTTNDDVAATSKNEDRPSA